MTSKPVDLGDERLHIDDIAPRVAVTARMVGIVGIVAAIVLAFVSVEAFLRGYVLNLAYFASLALGALFFVIIQHLTRAGWSVTVRRLAENITGALPTLALLTLPLLVMLILGAPSAIYDVYHWADPHVTTPGNEHYDEILAGKTAFLNVPFFVIRMLVYFGVWIYVANYFYSRSVEQDGNGDAQLSVDMSWFAAPAILLFALSVTFFAIDLLMSLEPHWFSTIFGVYYFSGAALGAFSLMALLAWRMQSMGRMVRSVTPEHYHDLGKLMFAFVVFWAYIAFSQYMLIWYANIGEETIWYMVRQQQPWLSFLFVLLIGHFFIPFFYLITRRTKRVTASLVPAAIWLLVMHYADMMVLVLPHVDMAAWDGDPRYYPAAMPTWIDWAQCVTLLIGFGGLFVGAVASRMGAASLVPQRDPRLGEALAFHNI